MKAMIIEVGAPLSFNDSTVHELIRQNLRLCIPISHYQLLTVWVEKGDIRTDLVHKKLLKVSEVRVVGEVDVSNQLFESIQEYVRVKEFISPIIENIIQQLQPT